VAVVAKIYKGQRPLGQYQVGCIDDKGYIYKGHTALGTYLVGCVDNNGRIYNSHFANGRYLVGCSDNRGNVYKNDHASTSASYLAGRVESNGNIGRVFKKTSSASVATIEGSNHLAGAMAFLILLNNKPNTGIDDGALLAGAAALLLSSDDESNPGGDGKGCYIATAVYKDHNAPEVLTLRNYRDTVLMNCLAGRLFVRLYYLFSPPVADRLRNTDKINNFVKKILNIIVLVIKK